MLMTCGVLLTLELGGDFYGLGGSAWGGSCACLDQFGHISTEILSLRTGRTAGMGVKRLHSRTQHFRTFHFCIRSYEFRIIHSINFHYDDLGLPKIGLALI